jgi:hypothetical protein
MKDNHEMPITAGFVETSSKHSGGPDPYRMVVKQTSSTGLDWLDTLLPSSLALVQDF